MSGGYDPTSTDANSALIRAQAAVYPARPALSRLCGRASRALGRDTFSRATPLRLPAGHFGLGHGSGAHAPNEYYVIESTNPKIQGIGGAIRSHVDYLDELAAVR